MWQLAGTDDTLPPICYAYEVNRWQIQRERREKIVFSKYTNV